MDLINERIAAEPDGDPYRMLQYNSLQPPSEGVQAFAIYDQSPIDWSLFDWENLTMPEITPDMLNMTSVDPSEVFGRTSEQLANLSGEVWRACLPGRHDITDSGRFIYYHDGSVSGKPPIAVINLTVDKQVDIQVFDPTIGAKYYSHGLPTSGLKFTPDGRLVGAWSSDELGNKRSYVEFQVVIDRLGGGCDNHHRVGINVTPRE